MILQWLNSNDNLLVFITNGVGQTLDLTTVKECHHALSSDNPAGTDIQGFLWKHSRIAASLYPINV